MAQAQRVLVTGATGLVGNALIPLLLEAGWMVRASARHTGSAAWLNHPRCEFIAHDLVSPSGNLAENMQAVVHLAARVHVMRDTVADPLAENRRLNTQATLQLAEAAADSGARQFVFLSSIKVNGEATVDRSYSEADAPAPQDAYAVSKLDAERGLAVLAARTTMGVTVLRSPLVYGRGVKGNFAALMRAIERGIPLPLASVHNLRSLIYAGNLADAIVIALTKPTGGTRTYLISDGEDLSTPQLIRTMAAAMGCKPHLWPVPPALLRLAAKLTGRSAAVDRLLGSLVVDSSLIRKELGWHPPFAVQQAMAASLSEPPRG